MSNDQSRKQNRAEDPHRAGPRNLERECEIAAIFEALKKVRWSNTT